MLILAQALIDVEAIQFVYALPRLWNTKDNNNILKEVAVVMDQLMVIESMLNQVREEPRNHKRKIPWKDI